MGRYGNAAIFFLFFFIATSAIGIVYWGNRYFNYTYEYNKNVESYYYRAATTNSLENAANYLQNAYNWLDQGFSGNPNIILPTPKTEWELVLSDLMDLIETTRMASIRSKPGDDSYEEALRQLDEKIYGTEDMDGMSYQTSTCYELEYTKRTLPILALNTIFFNCSWFLCLIFYVLDEEYY